MDKIRIWHVLLIHFALMWLSSARPASEVDVDAFVEMWQRPLQAYKRDTSLATSSTSRIWQDAAEQTMQPHRKRGFSMLARWKPFNTLARQRTSIRNINKLNRQMFTNELNEYGELVSAETRAYSRPHTPSGQPLRWG